MPAWFWPFLAAAALNLVIWASEWRTRRERKEDKLEALGVATKKEFDSHLKEFERYLEEQKKDIEKLHEKASEYGGRL